MDGFRQKDWIESLKSCDVPRTNVTGLPIEIEMLPNTGYIPLRSPMFYRLQDQPHPLVGK
jgi:hypothetical protein